MSTEMREFPAEAAAPAVQDEWTTILQNYTKSLAALTTAGLEHRRAEFLAHGMVSDCESSPAFEELSVLIAEMRQNEDAARRSWKVISEITFQSLLQIAQPQNRTKRFRADNLDELLCLNFKDDSQYLGQTEIWEPRLRILLRLALVDRRFPNVINRGPKTEGCSSSGDLRMTATREAALNQCCPLRMLSAEGSAGSSSQLLYMGLNADEFNLERVTNGGRTPASPQSLAAIGSKAPRLRPSTAGGCQDLFGAPFHDLLYAMPEVTIGLIPGSVPSSYELRQLIILSALLSDSVEASSIQILDWANRVVAASVEENRPLHELEAEDQDNRSAQFGKPTMSNSLLITLCLDQNLLKNVEALIILQEQLIKRWLNAIATGDPSPGFQVLQRLPDQPDFIKFLVAKTFIEAHRNRSFIGDQSLRQVHEQFFNQLRAIDEGALLTVYLETWCCLFDRMSDQDQDSESRRLNRSSDTEVTNNALMRIILFARDLSDELNARQMKSKPAVAGGDFTDRVEECLNSASAQYPFRDAGRVWSELERILAYIANSSIPVSRGAFTRAILATFHHTHKPSWFCLPAFVIWTSWTTTLLDVPFIPHYIATHQKDFPDTQIALTAMKNYRTGALSGPQTNGALAQLNQLIGASYGSFEMSVTLKAETGLTAAQASSPNAMLLAFLQTCITLKHV